MSANEASLPKGDTIMPKYTTISEFKHNHPAYTDAIQFVAVSENGEIHQFVMPSESWHTEMERIMTDYSFVNQWFVYTHTISV